MDSEKRYFNFPIAILHEFFLNKDKSFDNMLHYALYDHAYNKLKYGNLIDRFIESAQYHNVNVGNPKLSLAQGKELFQEYGGQKVKTGIETGMYWEFKNEEKTPFEYHSLIAYLGLKSILQKQAYCKVTNLYWLSRMDGYSSPVESIEELSEPLKALANEYQLKKLKFELMENWGIINYGRYTRGFYVSSKLQLEDLIFEVEKKRKARKVKKQQEDKKNALAEALKRLENV